MKPVDMKLPKEAAKKAMEAPISGAASGPRYPWGLELRLENESLDKLGIDTLPKVGEECLVHGVAKVVSVSKHDRDGGKPRRHVELQITKLALSHDDGDDEAFSKGFAKGPKRAY